MVLNAAWVSAIALYVLLLVLVLLKGRGGQQSDLFSWWNPVDIAKSAYDTTKGAVTTVGDFVGDGMISMTEAMGLKRPCEKAAAADIKDSILKDTKRPIVRASKKLGTMAGIDFTTGISRDLLEAIFLSKVYVATDEAEGDDFPFLTQLDPEAYGDLETRQQKQFHTGPYALERLILAKNCGTTSSLEKKWAKFGLSPREKLFTLKRGVKVVAAGTTIVVMAFTFGKTYTAVSGNTAKALFLGEASALQTAAVAAGMSVDTVASISGVLAAVEAAGGAGKAIQACADKVTPECVRDVYESELK